MNPKLDGGFLALILSCFVLLRIPSCVCQNDQQYRNCREPFRCGRLGEIGYPFYGGNRPISCGYPGFQLDCRSNDPLINIASIDYRVLDINNSLQTLTVSRNDLWSNLCPQSFFNTTLNFSLFDFYWPANDQNITIYYGCTFGQTLPGLLAPNYLFSCTSVASNFFVTTTQATGPLAGVGNVCTRQIFVPVNQTTARDLENPAVASAALLEASLHSGFSIQWSADNENCDNCVRSGGLCGYNETWRSFACHCTNGTFQSTCNGTPSGNSGTYK